MLSGVTGKEYVLILELKIIPSSGKQRWVLDAAGRLKCYLVSPPEDGKANRELISLLAGICGVLARDIVIIKGAASRHKVVKIPVALTREELLIRLGVA